MSERGPLSIGRPFRHPEHREMLFFTISLIKKQLKTVIKKQVLITLFMALMSIINAQQLAFPTAEGSMK
jgi:hypothetical protein